MSSFQNFKILPVIGMLVFLAACSTTKITTEANRDGILNKVPTWYLEAEVEKGLIRNRDAEEFIYGVGSSVSYDLQFALDKATTIAKSDLADQVNGRITQNESIYKEEGSGEGEDLMVERSTSQTNNIITPTSLPGYEEWNKDVFITAEGLYRVYVGLKWSETNNRLAPNIKMQKLEPVETKPIDSSI